MNDRYKWVRPFYIFLIRNVGKINGFKFNENFIVSGGTLKSSRPLVVPLSFYHGRSTTVAERCVESSERVLPLNLNTFFVRDREVRK